LPEFTKHHISARLTQSQTKIGNLKADIADTQTKLRTQQAEYKDCIAQLNEEKEAAEERAQRAEARVDSQQSRIDALYAKTRATAIADARYRANETTRIEAGSELLGVNLDGVPSRRSIMRMILEGGVLAELQMILGNISGNKESSIEQYTQAVESWMDKQEGPELGCAHRAQSSHS
jgi:F0F1-type ATP synthase membrane subunit b/b'